MFQVRDYSLFLPSPNADRAFRKLHRLELLVKVLLAALVTVCLWNIGVLIQLRLISSQDLADVRSISDDLSTRLVWILTLITLGAIVLREWTSGSSTAISILIPLSILLGLVLVPAAMSEIQPPLQDQTLRVVMNECPPKAIVNGRLSSMGRCTPRQIAEGDVLLAVSDPSETSFRTIPRHRADRTQSPLPCKVGAHIRYISCSDSMICRHANIRSFSNKTVSYRLAHKNAWSTTEPRGCSCHTPHPAISRAASISSKCRFPNR